MDKNYNYSNPSIPATGINPGIPSTGINPGIPSTRINPGISSAGINPSIPSNGFNPSIPSTGFNPGIPSARINPGIPSAGINHGIPSAGTNPGIPSDRLGPPGHCDQPYYYYPSSTTPARGYYGSTGYPIGTQAPYGNPSPGEHHQGIYVPAPIVVPNDVRDDESTSLLDPQNPENVFTRAIILACFTFFFCGNIFGVVAFVLAYLGLKKWKNGETSEARCMLHTSKFLSIFGVFATIVTIILLTIFVIKPL